MRVLLASLLLLGSVGFVQADADCTYGQNFIAVPFAKETITVSTAAVGLTAATYNPTNCTANNSCAIEAFMTTETDTMRFFVDGSTPTSSVGHQTVAGSAITICQASIAKFKAIRSGSSDVTLTVTYFKPTP